MQTAEIVPETCKNLTGNQEIEKKTPAAGQREQKGKQKRNSMSPGQKILHTSKTKRKTLQLVHPPSPRKNCDNSHKN